MPVGFGGGGWTLKTKEKNGVGQEKKIPNKASKNRSPWKFKPLYKWEMQKKMPPGSPAPTQNGVFEPESL